MKGSEWILGRMAGGGGVWSGSNWLMTRAVEGSFKCGDEPSGSGATDLVT
jgi:hypothetical protein